MPKYGIEGPVYLAPKDKNNAAAPGSAASGSAASSGSGSGSGSKQFLLDEEAQTVTAADGSVRYAVFDKCAVRIGVEEGVAHRRSLVLTLVDRAELPDSERVG